MKAPSLEKKASKGQTKVDELTAIDLPDHDFSMESVQSVCCGDRVDKEWTALRWYHKLGSNQFVETTRMYVSKTEVINCRFDLGTSWVFSSAKIKPTTFNAEKIVLQSKDVFDGTKLEYFKAIVNTMPNQSATLYMLTMYPEFEKMCKMGLEWICKDYITEPYQSSWKNFLISNIGDVDLKAKTPLKMIGINQYQANAINAYVAKMSAGLSEHSWKYRCVHRIIYKLKRAFNANALNSIDNETFDYILNSFSDESRLCGVYDDALGYTFRMYPKEAMYFIKDLHNAMKTTDHVEAVTQWGYRSTMSVDRMYYDTLRMIASGNYTDVLRPRFSSVEELCGHHQIMIDLINADAKRHMERTTLQYALGFEENKEKWKAFEWEGDEQFCVIAPTAPIDVAVEGITLRHCVKSYIPSVANGNTNILFIRKKEDAETPFFTVEVDKNKNIRQVHGMCNCNVDSVAGLFEFVKQWAKCKKLKYSKEYANGLRVAE